MNTEARVGDLVIENLVGQVEKRLVDEKWQIDKLQDELVSLHNAITAREERLGELEATIKTLRDMRSKTSINSADISGVFKDAFCRPDREFRQETLSRSRDVERQMEKRAQEARVPQRGIAPKEKLD